MYAWGSSQLSQELVQTSSSSYRKEANSHMNTGSAPTRDGTGLETDDLVRGELSASLVLSVAGVVEVRPGDLHWLTPVSYVGDRRELKSAAAVQARSPRPKHRSRAGHRGTSCAGRVAGERVSGASGLLCELRPKSWRGEQGARGLGYAHPRGRGTCHLHVGREGVSDLA